MTEDWNDPVEKDYSKGDNVRKLPGFTMNEAEALVMESIGLSLFEEMKEHAKKAVPVVAKAHPNASEDVIYSIATNMAINAAIRTVIYFTASTAGSDEMEDGRTGVDLPATLRMVVKGFAALVEDFIKHLEEEHKNDRP